MATKAPKLDSAQKKAVVALSDVKSYRQTQFMNQAEFWSRYGSAQSGGSRYESGRGMPTPMLMLMALHHMGVVSDEDLARAGAVAAELGKAGDGEE